MAVSKVSNRAMARASSLVTVTRMVASAMGVAGLTTYLTQQTASHALAIKTGLTTHQFSGVAATCARLAGFPFNQAAVRACIAQHAATQGLNETFWAVLIICVASIVLALILGRDPAVRAYQEVRARGEEVTPEPLPTMSE
jgi:hypothetical protein